MTITYPNRTKQATRLISMLFLVLGISGVLSIFFYNSTVSARRAVARATATLQSFQVKNADLKNQLYSLLDVKNVTAVASRMGLIKEGTPDYLRITAARDATRSPVVAVGSSAPVVEGISQPAGR